MGSPPSSSAISTLTRSIAAVLEAYARPTLGGMATRKQRRGSAARLSGAAAEKTAAAYLLSQGLTILNSNLRCKLGELDIVCLEREVLVIVEVRKRGSMDFGGALASVTIAKQRRLIRAAQFFWQRQPKWRKRLIRFDVVTLQGTDAEGRDGPTITWIRDAFRVT